MKNTNRSVGTKLSGEIGYHYRGEYLPEGTLTLDLEGSAGQSFGAFLAKGVKMILTGEANDYVGKARAAARSVRSGEGREVCAARQQHRRQYLPLRRHHRHAARQRHRGRTVRCSQLRRDRGRRRASATTAANT